MRPGGRVQPGGESALVNFPLMSFIEATKFGTQRLTVKVTDLLHQSVCVSLMFQMNDYSLTYGRGDGTEPSWSINGHFYTQKLLLPLRSFLF